MALKTKLQFRKEKHTDKYKQKVNLQALNNSTFRWLGTKTAQ